MTCGGVLIATTTSKKELKVIMHSQPYETNLPIYNMRWVDAFAMSELFSVG